VLQEFADGLVDHVGALPRRMPWRLRLKTTYFLSRPPRRLNIFSERAGRRPGRRSTARRARDLDAVQARFEVIHQVFDLPHAGNGVAQVVDVGVSGLFSTNSILAEERPAMSMRRFQAPTAGQSGR